MKCVTHECALVKICTSLLDPGYLFLNFTPISINYSRQHFGSRMNEKTDRSVPLEGVCHASIIKVLSGIDR